MELDQGRHKPFDFTSEDVISNMPDIVITNILDRLPLQDTVRTGVLSRNWRFKWTMISKLTIDDEFIEYLSRTQSIYDYVKIISEILLHLTGVITTFDLFVRRTLFAVKDVNNWILLLSRKGIKDLTFNNRGSIWLKFATERKLSTHLFSCLELKHLKLCYCCFEPPHDFHGFPNLLSLEMYFVQIESNDLWEFFTRCPLLESLKVHDLMYTREVKLVEIPKLENLRILSCDLHSMMITNVNIIFELLASLPNLQELHLDFFHYELTEGDVKKRVPISLLCLKALKLSSVDNDMMLSCAFELVRSFPNLSFLEITTMSWRDNSAGPKICSFVEENNTMGRLQLRNVVFTACCDRSGKDISIIKYLLACSPFLKKCVIHFDKRLKFGEKFVFAKKVLKLQRAYPAVDIDLHD